jgi:hypothetical protein
MPPFQDTGKNGWRWGEGTGVRRPRPASHKGRVDGARPATVSTGGFTSGAGLRFIPTPILNDRYYDRVSELLQMD